MQHHIIVGRLTRDVELKRTPDGKSVCTFQLAVRNDKGEADFETMIAWDKIAETISRFARKGDPLMIISRHGKARAWQGRDGQPHAVVEYRVDKFEFFGGRAERQQEAPVEQKFEYKRDDDLPEGWETLADGSAELPY